LAFSLLPVVMKLKQLMHAHPAWIICSPKYKGSYIALLKNTLGRVSSPQCSLPPWAGVVSYCFWPLAVSAGRS